MGILKFESDKYASFQSRLNYYFLETCLIEPSKIQDYCPFLGFSQVYLCKIESAERPASPNIINTLPTQVFASILT